MISKKDQFPQDLVRLSELAKGLSHPARISILQTLARKNGCICGELVEILPLAQSTVSQHLKDLVSVGFIRGEVEGPKSCYCINKETVDELTQLMEQFFGSLRQPSPFVTLELTTSKED